MPTLRLINARIFLKLHYFTGRYIELFEYFSIKY